MLSFCSPHAIERRRSGWSCFCSLVFFDANGLYLAEYLQLVHLSPIPLVSTISQATAPLHVAFLSFPLCCTWWHHSMHPKKLLVPSPLGSWFLSMKWDPIRQKGGIRGFCGITCPPLSHVWSGLHQCRRTRRGKLQEWIVVACGLQHRQRHQKILSTPLQRQLVDCHVRERSNHGRRRCAQGEEKHARTQSNASDWKHNRKQQERNKRVEMQERN